MSHDQKIAIVGLACRLPGGANSPEKLWDILTQKTDCITSVPLSRWDSRFFLDKALDAPGKTYVQKGGFLHEDIRDFDPGSFNLSEREAQKLDPQQRLLLELAWEALDHSGHDLKQWQSSSTGVFIGGFCNDNQLSHMHVNNLDKIDSFSSVATSMSILANRLSFTFNLTGPSLMMDTACSSSLVALHYAAQSIVTGECDYALIGGVNIMTSPFYFLSMSKSRFLSPTGKCQMFQEDANGYVRGEGGGIFVLRSLESAQENHDHIYAVIEGSGVNQDGRTLGISLPSQKAQVRLIRQVYKKAQVSPSQLNYIEAHGTGTQQGDLAESTALSKVFADKKEPCLVGSIKTNIGHLEAGAGIAGVLKAVLCLNYRSIPSNLYVDRISDALPLEKIKLVTQKTSLPDQATCYIGVNGFGFGGTNAHVLLSHTHSASPSPKEKEAITWPVWYPVTAVTKEALIIRAQQFSQWNEQHHLSDILYRLIKRTTHYDHRMVVIAENKQQLEKLLSHHGDPELADRRITGIAPSVKQSVVYVFSGMGPQWWGMGQSMYASCPIFRQAFDACDQAFCLYAGWSLVEKLLASEEETNIEVCDIVQPLSCALQIALSRVLCSRGVEHTAVIGHSLGELAAAHISGVLSLEEVMLLVYHRSRLQGTLVGQGTMLAAHISAQQAKEFLVDYTTLTLAAINGPVSVTFSGADHEVDQLAQVLKKQDVFHKKLRVNIPYHSQYMDPICDEFIESIAAIKPKKPSCLFFSTVTGHSGTEDLDANYWWRNLRDPVLFFPAMKSLVEAYPNAIFLEIGAHPVLSMSMEDIIKDVKSEAVVLATLNRKKDELLRWSTCLAELFIHGVNINFPEIQGSLIPIPTYPWQRTPCVWQENALPYTVDSSYVFLTKRFQALRPTWEVALSTQFFPYLDAHVVSDSILFPGTAFLEAMFQMMQTEGLREKGVLSNVCFKQFLAKDNTKSQSILSEYDQEHQRFTISSLTDHQHILPHCVADFRVCELAKNDALSFNQLKAQCTQQISTNVMYHILAMNGLRYGELFQGVNTLYLGDNAVLAWLALPPALEEDLASYIVHPVLLDSAFHSAIVLDGLSCLGKPYVPVHIEEVVFYVDHVPTSFWSYIQKIEQKDNSMMLRLHLFDKEGMPILSVNGLKVQRVASLDQTVNDLSVFPSLYTYQWTEKNMDKSVNLIDTPMVFFIPRWHESHRDILQELLFYGLDVYVFTNEKVVLDGITYVKDIDFNHICIQSLLDDLSITSCKFVWVSFPNASYDELVWYAERMSDMAQFFTHNQHIKYACTVLTYHASNGETQSILTGLTLLLHHEFSHVTAQSIDLPKELNPAVCDDLAIELAFHAKDTDVRLGQNGREILHLSPPSWSLEGHIYSVTLQKFQRDATYIVTGGSRGFGLLLVQWLLTQGARRIIIISRSGMQCDYASYLCSMAQKQGSVIDEWKGDVADELFMKKVFTSIVDTLPLKGIFHCAMVLDDGLLGDMNKERYKKVFDPKIKGALLLDQLSRGNELDFFVCTSSVSSCMGHVGQANYVAANTFLDFFVQKRRQQGLPATTINLGVLSDVGVIARDELLTRFVTLTGIHFTPAFHVVHLIEAMLHNKFAHVAIMDLDWPHWVAQDRQVAQGSRFLPILDQKVKKTESSLLSSFDFEQTASLIRQIIASVVGCAVTKVENHMSLLQLGMDSLMAAELRTSLVKQLGIDITLVQLLQGMSVKEMIEHVVRYDQEELHVEH